MISHPATFLILLSRLAMALSSSTPLFRLGLRADNTTKPLSCAKASSDASFAWTAQSLYFHSSVVFSTPAHQIDGGFVSFNLSNPALRSVTVCDQTSTQLHDFFYGDQWYSCEDVWKTPDDEVTKSWFRFDRINGRVDVNQTWTCAGQGNGTESYPVFFKASGTATQSLNCNRTFWQNANWTMGAIYSSETVECDPIDLAIKPNYFEEAA